MLYSDVDDLLQEEYILCTEAIEKVQKVPPPPMGSMSLLMDADDQQAVFRKGKTIFDFIGILPSMGMTIDEIREKGIAAGICG